MLQRARRFLSSPDARRFLSYSLVPFVLSGATCVFINDNIAEVTLVQGSSMEPTLSPEYSETGGKDLMLWLKLAPTEDLKRGDVVLFRNPRRPEGMSVKRVVALPGDVVLLDRKRRPDKVLNGRDNPDYWRWAAWEGRVRVLPGHVWLEGDNWKNTLDSNAYGPVSKSMICGKGVTIMWPWSRAFTRPWQEHWKYPDIRRTRVLLGSYRQHNAGVEELG